MRSLIFIVLFAAVLILPLVSANAQTAAQQPAPQTQESQTLTEREFATLAIAAENGDVASQARLGEEYATGTMIPQNYGYAYFWLTVAKIGGNSDYDSLRMEIQRQMTRESSTAIRERAHSWKPGDPVTITEQDPVAAPALTPEAQPAPPLTESDMSYGQQLKMRFRRWWNGLTMDY
jgi:TPR repeat protein